MSNKFVVGADVGGTAVKWIAGTDPATPEFSGEIPTCPNDIEATFQSLADAVRSKTDCTVNQFGLACAGVIDPVTSLLCGSPNLPGWQGKDLHLFAETIFPEAAVTIINDVNAALVGEWIFGAGRGHNNLAMLALGTGVGGALIIDGQLVTGSYNSAGEFGHMIIERGGLECACGNKGCLEAYTGSRGIVQRSNTELSVADLFKKAEAGDQEAIDLFRETGEYLAIGVGNLINIIDPDLVIIGGGVARAGDLIMKPCIQDVSKYVLASIKPEEVVVPAKLGINAAAIGVAVMARGNA
ncbi:MAG: ROK family protein [bacterium]|nr:ROK family protein [bacterium]MCP4800310.1 ROK family protein [bacterium]